MLSEVANPQILSNSPPDVEKSDRKSCCCGSFRKLKKRWQALIVIVLLLISITSIVLAITLTQDIMPNQGN